MSDPLDPTVRPLVSGFVRRNFGLFGTLGLHRHALGWDLLRAPANVLLAVPGFILRVTIWLCLRAGRVRLAGHLARVRLAFPTALSREIDRRLRDELLEPLGLLPEEANLRSYADVRAATGEMTATAGTLGAGAAFKTLTPGVITLSPLIAGAVAQGSAVAAFPLGSALGSMWYGAFPPDPSLPLMIGSGVVLAIIFSLVATFAGLLTDPLQTWLGIHRWRLMRLIRVLDAATHRPGTATEFTAPEHGMARTADIAELMVTLHKVLRG